MKNRLLPFAILFIITSLICGCGKDVAPQKTTGSVTFVITEENTPEPLSGVTIQLFSDDDKSISPSDRTDNSGRCTFSNIPVGAYSVNLSKPGYESKEGLALRIGSGDDSYKELSLKRITTILTVQPSTLDFGNDESTVQKAFSLVNPNYETLTWAVLDTEVPWIISVCDKDGKKNGSIKYNQEVAMSISIDRDKLASGNNESTIVILSDNGRAELKVKAVGADRRTAVTNMLEITDVDMTTAVFNGEVLSVGSPEYTERGFVYSTSSIAENASSGFIKIAAQMNTSKNFSVNVSDLGKGTKYYVRAYGKNSIGMKLSSNEVSFATIASKTVVTTLDVTNIDVINGKANFNGTITDGGDPIYSEKGFCYNITGEPTTSNNKITVPGNEPGKFNYSCANLSPNMTYYVRAYAIQNEKTIYGSTVNFSTSKSTTVVTTSAATNITLSSATLNGTISREGNPIYTEKGFCYTTGYTPTINSTKIIVSGSGEGNFSTQINGLDYGTNYHFRAYAIQNGSPIYGEILYFVTDYTEAIVNTNDASSIGYTSITFNGQVLSDGEPKISERGFCYSSSTSMPTIGDNKIQVTGISPGTYSTTVSNLEEETKYYYRAYVIQAGVPLYGAVKNAKTELSPQVLTGPAIDIGADDVVYGHVTIQGAFADDGSKPITEAGFVYGRENNPTISTGTKVNFDKSTSIADKQYRIIKKLSKVARNSTYYYRVYVKTSVDYTYGESYSFYIE